ncbi:ADP-ribosylation factor-binding protein GGA1-like isoform X3 [Dinothrombium tinctorium]|uniref:ADP-ribosylation factor-binding protein GGA1-like isoform X3 n=1 Tax=Dinothrombium tinctorium TaxID=1965070 RepID=A0A3S3SKN2_9ACAR|nr:ADP-ribosylation factor-binding protein GGA1-like isoform X3 [Dinothrombium tinctorium]
MSTMDTKAQQALDICLVKVTNPLNTSVDDNTVCELIRAIDETREGSQIALQFIAHKIQSPQEIEAIQALNILDILSQKNNANVNAEIGKFRFLNELIKVVSPKYLAHRSSPKVKQKVIELIYKWSVGMKSEPKIAEAYLMLKKQSIVFNDPIHVLPCYDNPSRRKDDPFGDEENSRTLQRLLQSKNPEDLQAANKLIKLMVKEADKKMNLKARCSTELETVYNNARVLSDMLMHYIPGQTTREELELFKELYESCESLRPKLFRLAGEMEEKDPELQEILQANDELTKVINEYKSKMGLNNCSNNSSNASETSLLDLNSPTELPQTNIPFLNNDLLSLNLSSEQCSHSNFEFTDRRDSDISVLDSISCNGSHSNLLVSDSYEEKNESNKTDHSNSRSSLSELEELMRKSVTIEKKIETRRDKTPLNQLQKASIDKSSNSASSSTSDLISAASSENNETLPPPLTNLVISLDSIEPSSLPPVPLIDKDGIKVFLNFAKESPRKDVTVMVITTVNTNKITVSHINFQAAVPKNMRVKLQSPSSSILPPYNPFLPPAAITQVMLIARKSDTDKVRFKYKFKYTINDKCCTEIGEIDHLFSNINTNYLLPTTDK